MIDALNKKELQMITGAKRSGKRVEALAKQGGHFDAIGYPVIDRRNND